jgi:hypothetical protein
VKNNILVLGPPVLEVTPQSGESQWGHKITLWEKCKIVPADTKKKSILFEFGEYENERIRGGPKLLGIIHFVQNITNILRIRIRMKMGQSFVFGEYEYTAIPDCSLGKATVVALLHDYAADCDCDNVYYRLLNQ